MRLSSEKNCQLRVMSSQHACLTFGGIQPTREALMGVVSCDKMSCSGSDERYHPTPMIGMLGCWLFCHSLPDTSTAFFSEIRGVTKIGKVVGVASNLFYLPLQNAVS